MRRLAVACAAILALAACAIGFSPSLRQGAARMVGLQAAAPAPIVIVDVENSARL